MSDDLDELLEAWKRGEAALVEADPETHRRIMAALDAIEPTNRSLIGVEERE